MTIYTSYYRGEIKGEAVSISLYPPPGWTGKHLLLFAPTPELLQWWKSSAKDATAQDEYKRRFRDILDSRQQLIQLWVGKQKDNLQDMTFCCFEPDGQFCHRHQFGEEVVQKYLPHLWGGEIGATRPQRKIVPSQKLNLTYPLQVLSLIDKCHSSGFPVVCDRTPCGYYQVSLQGEDLGVWSELGLMGLLSQLRHEFYRPRLIPSLAEQEEELALSEGVAAGIASVAEPSPQESSAPSSPSLITHQGKLEGEELAQVQDWCKSVKSKMFPSVSQYADGRMELHLRRFVSLASAKSEKKTVVKTVDSSMYPGAEMIEAFGEKLLPDFHQALVLYYPAGTQIKIHRDSPAYANGAAQINVMGRAKFSISGCQDVRKMESYWLEEGDCIAFDNKQPHGIERVGCDRFCVCFFKLKAEYLESERVEQLSLV
ncbi:DUF488 family protein, N3 subclade [Anabaena azotica]|uniref:DUF488 domain-containing protein n=1 Tax=Anabaena azotica FACHB-119 TaxID=947527 RepID=A0ABR8DCY4_9NOST|nr:hypothetical protein [Anabaena azotica]MBD2505095.1 hypothetical protein [Anabaena azotica FACHB-119]